MSIARAGRTVSFPARFQLVAAMNPCPCGYAGTWPEGQCTCSVAIIQRYERRVSGPLRDRIDLWVPMPRVAPSELVTTVEPEPSVVVARRILEVRERSLRRNDGRLNARLRGRQLRALCRLDDAGGRRAWDAAGADLVSGRGMERLLRVARTIADMAGADRVAAEHLDEARSFHPTASGADRALAS